MRVPFAPQSYRHRSLPISAQRLINWFVETEPKDAKSQTVLLPTPGIVLFATLPQGPVRGRVVQGDKLYVVSGTTLYSVTATGTVASIGTIPGTEPVSVDENGSQVIIVDPITRRGWVAASGSLTQITDSDFLGAVAVTVIDGYAVFVKPDSTEFFLSAINNALAYDALDFASAEGSPDNLVTVKRVGRELWLFGERTVEVWSNIGGADFPFLRVSGGMFERGCAARQSVVTGAGTVAWLADDRAFYVGEGFRPVRISTHAIEQALAGYGTINDARGWFYEQEGHQFFGWTFPTDGATWVIDMATRQWHERESEGYAGWRCIDAVAFAGGTIAGDIRSGNLYRVDTVLYDELGTLIRRSATGAGFHAEGKRIFFHSFEVDMETGTGLQNGQGSDPQIWVQHSDDGGRTWSNERMAAIGPPGQHKRRVRWQRLGASRDRVFRLSMADPVRTALIAANVEATPGAH